MAAKLVPVVRTTYTKVQLIQGFIEGWVQLYGQLPRKESIAVIYAQNCIETGGTAAMWNNNIGNIKFVPSSDPDQDLGKEYMMLKNVWEIVNGKRVTFQPPHPATWFRSFPTLAEGIAFHYDFLRNRPRYKAAWGAVEKGDPALFSHLLRVGGYYTAPEEDYTKAVVAYFNRFMKDNIFETVIQVLQNQPKKSVFESTISKIIPIIDMFRKK